VGSSWPSQRLSDSDMENVPPPVMDIGPSSDDDEEEGSPRGKRGLART
jgi:hypothetical protein